MSTTAVNDPVFRITALWAFSECALGGMMHALKLPFTGFLVGGFAVLCIGLLAHHSQRSAAVILRATFLVILAKAAVSPHSPPMAYLAVGFQGAVGAFLLGYVRPFALAAPLFGFCALVESAIQKILILILFFGKPLLEAVDVFFNEVLKNLGIKEEMSWAAIAVWGYVGLYAIWGLILGNWILTLPHVLSAKSKEYATVSFPESAQAAAEQKKQKRPWLFFSMVLLFVVATFLFTGAQAGGTQKAMYAVVRSVAVIAAWFVFVQPLAMWAIRHWAARKSAGEQSRLSEIVEGIPVLRVQSRAVMQYVSDRYSGWARLREFVLALFVVAIYREP